MSVPLSYCFNSRSSIIAVFQLVMPWDRRTETHTAKRRRLEREAQREKETQRHLDQEKFNAVDQYLLSADEQACLGVLI